MNTATSFFLDPDKSLRVRGSLTDRSGAQYIALNELKDYFSRGQDVVFYNHEARQQPEAYLEKFRTLKNEPAFSCAQWFGLKYSKGTVRDYIFILHAKHFTKIREPCEMLLSSKWAQCFAFLKI